MLDRDFQPSIGVKLYAVWKQKDTNKRPSETINRRKTRKKIINKTKNPKAREMSQITVYNQE